jgi:hypothetical protein
LARVKTTQVLWTVVAAWVLFDEPIDSSVSSWPEALWMVLWGAALLGLATTWGDVPRASLDGERNPGNRSAPSASAVAERA